MILAVREICIFMIIAQAVMFFVPSGSYMKYVRVLVGILMILRITEPILTFLADDGTGQEIQGRMQELWDGMSGEGGEISVEDGSLGIYRGIEEELMTRLKQCPGDFEVREVKLLDEEGQVMVTVAPRSVTEETGGREKIIIGPVVLGEEEPEGVQAKEAAEEKDEELRELYGGSIGVSPERIKIRYAEGRSIGR